MADWTDLSEDYQMMIIDRLEMRDIVNNRRVLDQPSRRWLRQRVPFHPRIHYRSMTFERIEETRDSEAYVEFVALDLDNNGITGKIPFGTLGNFGRTVISHLFETALDVDEMECMKLRDTDSFDLNRGVFVSVRSLLLVCCSMVANKSIWSRCHPRRMNTFQLLTRYRDMFDLEQFGIARIENIRQWNVLLPQDPTFIIALIEKWISQNLPIGTFAQSWVQHFHGGTWNMITSRFRSRLIGEEHWRYGLCIYVTAQKMIIIRARQYHADYNRNNYTNEPYDVFVMKMVAIGTSEEECEDQTEIDLQLKYPHDFSY